VVAVRRLSSVVRPVLPHKAIVVLFATFASIALLPCGVALAGTVTTDFEGFTVCSPAARVFDAPCTVNGQDGWKSGLPGKIGPTLPIGYDQQVVNNSDLYRYPGTHPAPAAFGAKSLRISNAYNTAPPDLSPEYHSQTYSKPTTDAAGQSLTNTVFTGEFSFISVTPDAEQPGLHIDVSPSDAEGGRMSYIGLTDEPTGIDVLFYDTAPDGSYVPYDLGIVPRDKPHTIKFWIRLVPGPNNDLVRITIDGKDVGQCFTTWESSYPKVPVIDRLLFRSTGAQVIDSLIGGGFLFDNVTVTTAPNGGPQGCDLPIEKHADSPTVTAGGLAGYTITVQNKGRVTERNLLVCDRIPRQMTFVSADRRLRRIGRRRCFVIPRLAPGQSAGFHITLRVNANAKPGTLDNTAEETPVQPPSVQTPPGVLPSLPEPPEAPAVPAKITEPPAIEKVTTSVKVVAKPSAPAPPPVTG
jgi:uncharacterized repeat protein (TIGR01451 family)